MLPQPFGPPPCRQLGGVSHLNSESRPKEGEIRRYKSGATGPSFSVAAPFHIITLLSLLSDWRVSWWQFLRPLFPLRRASGVRRAIGTGAAPLHFPGSARLSQLIVEGHSGARIVAAMKDDVCFRRVSFHLNVL